MLFPKPLDLSAEVPFERIAAARPDLIRLIAGDESGLPAIGAIIESMPPTTCGLIFVEVPGGAGEQPLDTSEDVQLRFTAA
ncbi:MAG: SIP domain-containing protein [Egibacteraceae bacterium]